MLQLSFEVLLPILLFLSDAAFVPEYQRALHLLPTSQPATLPRHIPDSDLFQQPFPRFQLLHQFHHLLRGQKILSSKNLEDPFESLQNLRILKLLLQKEPNQYD